MLRAPFCVLLVYIRKSCAYIAHKEIKVVPDFGSGKSRIWPFSEIRRCLAPAKYLDGLGRFLCS